MPHRSHSLLSSTRKQELVEVSGVRLLKPFPDSLKQGSPTSKTQSGMSRQVSSGSRLEIKCTVSVMSLNHPETIPPPLSLWKKLSSTKPVSGAEKVGDCCKGRNGRRSRCGREASTGLLLRPREPWKGPNSSRPRERLLESGASVHLPSASHLARSAPGSCPGLALGRLPGPEQVTPHLSLHFLTCETETIPAWLGVGGCTRLRGCLCFRGSPPASLWPEVGLPSEE